MRQDNKRVTAPPQAVLLSAALALSIMAGCDDGGPGTADSPAAEKASVSVGGGDEHGHDHSAHGPSGEEAHGEEGHDHHAHEGHADEIVLTPEAIRRNGIRTAKAKLQPLNATLAAPARVAYDAETIAHVGSTVSGRVTELKVRIGETVKKGDILLVIDSPELGEAQSDFLQKRTAIAIAEPAADLLKQSFERAKQLYEQSQGISLTEVQSRQREYEAARGALLSAQTAAMAAENKLHLLGVDQAAVQELIKTGEINPKASVRAPLDGRVIEREATLGELVGPDREKLIMLANLQTVWVLVDVPEAKLREVAIGSPVQIVVPALGDQVYEGTVAYIVPELDPATRTVRVRVEVKNPEMKLMPGMFARADVSLAGASSEPVLAVTEEAVQTVEGDPVVFVPVEGEPNTFAPRQVGVGEPVGGMVPVFAGLKEGAPYVASGSFILKAELGKAGAAHEH